MNATKLLAVAVLALAAFIAACGGDDDGDPIEVADTPEAECAPADTPEPKEVELERPGRVLERASDATAVVATNCGEFTIDLDTQRSPRTANSFAFLAERGFYDDTAIHRIAPGFVIQGGDPQGDGTGGPGYSVDEPPPQRTAYLRGVVAMAKTAAEPPGRSGSQFFVVTAPADANLPPEYAVLGEVGDGMEVVEQIGELGDANEQPLQPIVIESVTIERQ
jgi:peptidyl-prolyl cis-trans isomerase B (cyclophilin B)